MQAAAGPDCFIPVVRFAVLVLMQAPCLLGSSSHVGPDSAWDLVMVLSAFRTAAAVKDLTLHTLVVLSFAVLVQAPRLLGSSRLGLAREPHSLLAQPPHRPHLPSTLGHKVGRACWILCCLSGP